MQLHEYQAKRILAGYGVPVPPGRTAASVDEVRQIAEELGQRTVLKAQVLIGGRGRAGGIQLANDAAEAERLAQHMFGIHIQGYVASRLLVDQAVDIEQEIYLGVTIDAVAAQPVIVASAVGGVEIAQVAHDTPERVCRTPIDPRIGLRAYQVRELAYDIGLSGQQTRRFVPIAMALYRAFAECDATLVESNPLVICPDGKLVSLNAKIVIDDNALFRHQDLSELRDESQETAADRLARRHSVHYVRLGGNVGCLSTGAGLAMATMDLLRHRGVKTANYVAIGTGAPPAKMIVGLRLALTHSVQAVLVNAFGVTTRCDEMARGILDAYDELSPEVPIVVRLEGAKRQAGSAYLAESAQSRRYPTLYVAHSLEAAVDHVYALSTVDALPEPVR